MGKEAKLDIDELRGKIQTIDDFWIIDNTTKRAEDVTIDRVYTAAIGIATKDMGLIEELVGYLLGLDHKVSPWKKGETQDNVYSLVDVIEDSERYISEIEKSHRRTLTKYVGGHHHKGKGLKKAKHVTYIIEVDDKKKIATVTFFKQSYGEIMIRYGRDLVKLMGNELQTKIPNKFY